MGNTLTRCLRQAIRETPPPSPRVCCCCCCEDALLPDSFACMTLCARPPTQGFATHPAVAQSASVQWPLAPLDQGPLDNSGPEARVQADGAGDDSAHAALRRASLPEYVPRPHRTAGLYFALTLRAQVRRARVYVRPPPGVCAAANGRESTRFDFDAGRNAGVG